MTKPQKLGARIIITIVTTTVAGTSVYQNADNLFLAPTTKPKTVPLQPQA